MRNPNGIDIKELEFKLEGRKMRLESFKYYQLKQRKEKKRKVFELAYSTMVFDNFCLCFGYHKNVVSTIS